MQENLKYRILSCDGGGIRGLITAMLLQELDKELGILSKVNLFAGTSTGGIIALGLASGVKISQLVNLYNSPKNCSEIFKTYPSYSEYWEGWLRYVKYDNTGLNRLLQQYLPKGTLAELKSKVLITTFQLYNESDPSYPSWRPLTLDNLPHSESQNTLVVDAALCTSAAPVYFPPYKHPSYGYCIDGGVFANNPSTLALARVLNSGIINDIKDVKMLSIGTGSLQNYLPVKQYQPDPFKYGAIAWFWYDKYEKTPNTPTYPLLSILFESSSILEEFQSEMLLSKTNYNRVELKFNEFIEMDDCSKIYQMEELVNKYIDSPKWNSIKDWIEAHFL